MNPRFSYVLLPIFLLFTSPSQEVTNAQRADQSSLQGTTEAVLVNDETALRIVTQKSGATAVLYQKRDDEDALVFSAVRLRKLLGNVVLGNTGKFYVTRTRLIYDPDGSKENYFNFARTEIKEAVREHHGWG